LTKFAEASGAFVNESVQEKSYTHGFAVPVMVSPPQTFTPPPPQWKFVHPLPSQLPQLKTLCAPPSAGQRSKSVPASRPNGGLGPDIGGEEYIQRMRKLMKQREYAAKVRQENLERELMRRATVGPSAASHSQPRIVTKFDESRDEARRRREKMKEYASHIPRPVLPPVQKEDAPNSKDVIVEAALRPTSHLQQLERQYHEKLATVAKIKRDLGVPM
jgi:hypothetical protein